MTTRTSTPPGTAAALPWFPLSVLSLAAFATVTAELVPGGLLLEVSADLDVPPPAVGALVSAWAVTAAVLSVPLVRLTGRLPVRGVLTASLALGCAAAAAVALAPSFEVALAARVAGAAAHGLLVSLLVPYVTGSVPEAVLGRAISVVLAGPTLAGVLGVPAGTAAGERWGWRTTFAAIAVLLALAAVAMRRLPAAAPAAPGARASASWRDPSVPAVLRIAVAAALVLVGHFALYTYVAPLLADAGGFGAPARALLLLAFGVAGAAGLAASGPLSDRWPRAALAGVAVAFAASTAAVGVLERSATAGVVAIAVWGVLIGALPPVFQTRLMRVASPGFRPTAGALAVATLNLGVAGGAALGARVLESQGAGALPARASAVVALAAVVLLVDLALPARAGRRAPA